MGLRFAGSLLALVFLSLSPLHAAPMLRLSSATIGPISLAAAGATSSQVLDVYNAGDGNLALSFSSSVPWISAAPGASRTCRTLISAVGKTCSTIQVSINSTGLPQGLSTGVLTVSDPNAIDAPQTVTVTVRIGAISVDVAPGGSRDVPFTASSYVNTRPTTQDGGTWLSVVTDAFGSFRFDYPYRIQIHPPSAMAQGNYSGTVAISGATNPTDNQTIPVNLRVTTLPIAVATPDRLSVRLAQGAAAQTTAIAVDNQGQGSLTIQSVSATGSGITATAVPTGASVTLDPGSLTPGVYAGSVSITSNAENTLTVPVQFEVISAGAPTIFYQGVVDNGTFVPGDPVSPGDIVVVKGEQLANGGITLGSAPPLTTQIGGATILVNQQPVPMYYSTYGQLAFQMPTDTPIGTALVQVQRDGLSSNIVSVPVVERAPRLLVIGTTGYGAIQIASDYAIPMAANALPGVLTHPAQAGDVLIIYAIGLGPTTPAVATGAAAPSAPVAAIGTPPQVIFGDGISPVTVAPFFAGLSPGSAGLYQVNVVIPDNAPKGIVELRVAFADSASNPVNIVIQ